MIGNFKTEHSSRVFSPFGSILKGSFIFLADLVRHITVPHQVEFMALSSYGDSTQTSGNVRIIMDLRRDIVGKHVLVVEDIVDTGHTLNFLLNLLKTRSPASVVSIRWKERTFFFFFRLNLFFALTPYRKLVYYLKSRNVSKWRASKCVGLVSKSSRCSVSNRRRFFSSLPPATQMLTFV
jgi:hypoxanthine phosphoribosyltransferase